MHICQALQIGVRRQPAKKGERVTEAITPRSTFDTTSCCKFLLSFFFFLLVALFIQKHTHGHTHTHAHYCPGRHIPSQYKTSRVIFHNYPICFCFFFNSGWLGFQS